MVQQRVQVGAAHGQSTGQTLIQNGTAQKRCFGHSHGCKQVIHHFLGGLHHVLSGHRAPTVLKNLAVVFAVVEPSQRRCLRCLVGGVLVHRKNGGIQTAVVGAGSQRVCFLPHPLQGIQSFFWVRIVRMGQCLQHVGHQRAPLGTQLHGLEGFPNVPLPAMFLPVQGGVHPIVLRNARMFFLFALAGGHLQAHAVSNVLRQVLGGLVLDQALGQFHEGIPRGGRGRKGFEQLFGRCLEQQFEVQGFEHTFVQVLPHIHEQRNLHGQCFFTGKHGRKNLGQNLRGVLVNLVQKMPNPVVFARMLVQRGKRGLNVLGVSLQEKHKQGQLLAVIGLRVEFGDVFFGGFCKRVGHGNIFFARCAAKLGANRFPQ